jgi:serine/threonine-protein kinase
MGEVYRARDLKLQRDVALKVLLSSVAADHDRLARFSREAQLLAALNHPNIAQIHGSEDAAGVTALILEFVEGEDLSSRIARGPVPPDEALAIARQIAAALAAAHNAGIVHRDLKPANVKLRPDGTIKVLDFGLAKTVDPDAGGSGSLDNSPTITAHATGMGVILGTVAYMSPEQARGRVVDRRTDIFALGCVLFEMLTGVRAFRGDDATDTIVAVLTKPPDWSLLPAATPPAIGRLLRHMLEKDATRRLDSATAVSLAIEDALATPADATVPASRTRPRPLWWAIAGLAAGALGAFVLISNSRQRPETVDGVTRSVIGIAPAEYLKSLPADDTFGEGRPSGGFALSPDGRALAFSAVANGRQQLLIRRLDALEAVARPGTDDAHSPFFSPDGQWVGFFASGALHKVAVGGTSPPTEICKIPDLFGASWGPDGNIVYALESGGLWRVSADGGAPQQLTTPQRENNEYSHRLPHVLPGGNAVVFTVIDTYLSRWDQARLEVVDLTTRERRALGVGADARYSNSGHLVFIRAGTLIAAPFNPKTATIVGPQVAVLDGVAQAANMPNAVNDTGVGQFSISQSGTLVYARGGIFPDREMVVLSVDRRGRAQPLPLQPRPYLAPRLSPDDKRLVVYSQGLERTVWAYDLERATQTRVVREGRSHRPIWTPDGRRIVYAGAINGTYNLFIAPADGSRPGDRLTDAAAQQIPSSWTPDGTLIFLERRMAQFYNIMTLSIDGDHTSKMLLGDGKVRFTYPEISPDGKWIAYVSNESGREEVYVRSYPALDDRSQVSNSGGRAPAWSRKTGELFFTSTVPNAPLAMMSVPIVTSPGLKVGLPQQLFAGPYFTHQISRGYDVSSDGQRFFMTQVRERPPVRTRELVLVQNWTRELDGQGPPRR